MSAKIAKALHEVMKSCAYVQKTGHNKFHGYKYAGEADLLAVLRPAMIEAGLLLLPSVVECRPVDEHGNTTVIMEYTLAHKDGEVWPHPIRIAGTGNDKSSKGGIGDKGTYKALTGANKYLLFKLFQIETGDDPEHDEKSNHLRGDPIQAAKESAVNEDSHLLANGDTRSQYDQDKARKWDDWISAQKALMAKATSEDWWHEPERQKNLERLKRYSAQKHQDLWLTFEAHLDRVDRAAGRVLQAG